MEQTQHFEKLLSHRLRGFSPVEHSFSALVEACKSNAPYLEVDTRVTKDGEIYLYHDAQPGKLIDVDNRPAMNRRFIEMDSHIVDTLRYANGEPILSLRKALRYFKKFSKIHQRLCIDIKDYGFEKEHLNIVKQHGLQEKVCFVSWIPQTIMSLYEFTSDIPLILSHLNITRLGAFGRILSFGMRRIRFAVGPFAILGSERGTDSISPYATGFQHGYVTGKLPEQFVYLLRDSGGGICVHKEAVCSQLITYCRQNEIGLWIFSVQTKQEYLKYAEVPGIDVIFCDDANAVLE
jgi:glycerophosphoryl diester phosphodiesterase